MNRLNLRYLIVIIFLSGSFCQVFSDQDLSMKYQRAKSLEKAGLTEEAIQSYEELVAYTPGNKTYFKAYKSFLKNRGMNDRLYKLASDYFNANPGDPVAELEYIEVILLNDDPDWEAIIKDFIDRKYENPSLMKQVLYKMVSGRQLVNTPKYLDLVRTKLGIPTFYTMEMGGYFAMRMDYKNALSEYILFLSSNPKRIDQVSDRIMSFPQQEQITKLIRKTLQQNLNGNTGKILSELEFREKNYSKSWEILKKWSSNEQDYLNLGKSLIELKELDFALEILHEMMSMTKNHKMIEKCVFQVGRIYEIISIESTNILPLSGFFRGNPFFTSPFLRVTDSSKALLKAIDIYDSLSTANHSPQAQFRLAEIQFRVFADLDKAEILYRDALKGFAGQDEKTDCILRIADVFKARGDLDSVEDLLSEKKRSISSRNDLNSLEIVLGQLMMYRGELDTLNEHVREIMSWLKSTDSEFNDLLDVISLNLAFHEKYELYSEFGSAQLLLQQNKRSEALNILENLTDIDKPVIAELVQYQTAYIHFLQQDYQIALESAQVLSGETIYSELAQILQAEIVDFIYQDIELAVNIYLEFLKRFPDSIYYDEIRLRLRQIAS